MHRISTTVLILLAATAVLSAGQEPEPGEQALPATDINRESNNPAKAAIKAKQAQEKDEANTKSAKQESQAADAAVSPPISITDDLQLVRNVEAALRNDARTSKLGVAVRLDEDKLVGLHGPVPSPESRAAVIAVATKVAGAVRIKSHLVVTGRK